MKLSRQDIECLELARNILFESPNDHITIELLSTKVGMNQKKLKYGFKQLFFVSIHNFQVQLRMKRAKDLLGETDIPIKQIAFLTGYGNKSSFGVAFKKNFKKSPSQWRNYEE